MKKFVLGAAGLILCLFGLYYAVFFKGFYIGLGSGHEISVTVKTDGREILVLGENGQWEPFIIRGVDVSSSIAGHFATDYAVDEETWLRWFARIMEMGGNTIRIYTIYDDDFYNAFYQFNENRDTPLYLLQGLQVSDYANHSSQDAYGQAFYKVLRRDALDAVDVVHGRKNIALNRMKGSGMYRRDVSPWVLGYVLGGEWDSGTIAYTDHNRKQPESYQGEYIRTGEGSTVFEAMLAGIMDEMVGYETDKYGTQKLVSFQNDPQNDPFEYEENYGRQLGKFQRMDAQHLAGTDRLCSGYFAAYRLYEFCPDFLEYFSQQQHASLGEIAEGLDTSLYCDGYTQLLSRYHTMPVVITGYGFSSSRGTDNLAGPLTEAQQGQRLIEVYEDILRSGCSGAFISGWQDAWERRTWNTSYAADVENANQWHDLQTDGQGYGLLAFVPGEEEPVCLVDGEKTEWGQEEVLLQSQGYTLSLKYDAECLYMLIEKEMLGKNDRFYVALDTTPRSGSLTCVEPPLTFTREADFLVTVQGDGGARLLVQSRYDALRENYLQQVTGEDPFVTYPAADEGNFVPIRQILRNRTVTAEDASEEELKTAKFHETREAGLLRPGDGNPEHEDYNSLADICYGGDFVEIRIPWLLLNFSDPSDMEIHDDYYEKYGVEWFPISQMYLGLGNGQNQTVEMTPFALKGWGADVKYHERLKRSYYIIKESWGGADES